MRILFVTSEVARYAKTGGLADVSAALPKYLLSAGHEVRVVMPLYSRVDLKGASVEPVVSDLDVTVAARTYRVSIVRAQRGTDAPVHLVDCPPLYQRAGLYTQDPDEHLRFLVAPARRARSVPAPAVGARRRPRQRLAVRRSSRWR